jgi:hypothetical protein
VEFTLVLTVVLGLCVGAVVADVLFGPEQPATSSSGSNGDQWDPWRRWLRQGREGLHAFGQWLRRSGERGWAAVARTFPDRRADGARNPDVLPPPAAPPLRPDRVPPPRPITFADAPPEPRVPPTGHVGAPDAAAAPGLDWLEDFDPSAAEGDPPRPAPAHADAREPHRAPVPDRVPAPSGNGDAQHLPHDDERLPRPAGAGAGTITALRQRLASPVAPPVAVTIPRQVRMRAGIGLLIYTVVIGLAMAMTVLGTIGVAIKVLGGI